MQILLEEPRRKTYILPPERDFYQGTPSKCDWASFE